MLDELAPIKSRTVRCGKKSSRWLSVAAVAAKRRRRQLERRWKRTAAECDRVAYRAACREANVEINRSRETFYHDRLQSAAVGDQRTQWRVVRELLHNDDQRDDYNPVDARRLCITFSRFFVEKLARIAAEVKSRLSTTSGMSRCFSRRVSAVSMDSFSSVTVDEVTRMIRQLPPKSSPLDCMPVSLLKDSVEVMAPLLARLANVSFATGVFPSRYKSGRVVPLLKKVGLSKDDPANYRPIPNLSTFSKLLEKLALARLQPHVFASGNMSQFQSAYRSGFSTETALLKIVNDIERGAGDGKCTVLLALDISATFDAIDHSILFRRAEDYVGLRGTALGWLRSFIVNRSQYVAVGNERSATTLCATGIGQGTVLGPLCFSMYVSPVGDVIDAHRMRYHQYADDL